MNQRSYFLDSNVWLYYLLDNQSISPQERKRKRDIASSLTHSNNIIVPEIASAVEVRFIHKLLQDHFATMSEQ